MITKACKLMILLGIVVSCYPEGVFEKTSDKVQVVEVVVCDSKGNCRVKLANGTEGVAYLPLKGDFVKCLGKVPADRKMLECRVVE